MRGRAAAARCALGRRNNLRVGGRNRVVVRYDGAQIKARYKCRENAQRHQCSSEDCQPAACCTRLREFGRDRAFGHFCDFQHGVSPFEVFSLRERGGNSRGRFHVPRITMLKGWHGDAYLALLQRSASWSFCCSAIRDANYCDVSATLPANADIRRRCRGGTAEYRPRRSRQSQRGSAGLNPPDKTAATRRSPRR